MAKLASSADASYLLHSVLPLDSMCTVARWYGWLTYLTHRRQRSTVRRNLATTFGTTKSRREIDALTRQFFEQRRVRGLLLAVSPGLDESELAKLIRIDGLEHLDAALARNRGVILLGCHLNSLLMFPATMLLRKRGYDIHTAIPQEREMVTTTRLGAVLHRHFKTKTVSELIRAFHVQFNIRPIVRLLEQNAIVAQTGDGLHAARFVDVDFLDRKIPFPTGMASIAQLTGAVVVPVFQVGAPPDRLRLLIEEPWTVERDSDGESSLNDAVAAYAKRLEVHLVENIASWEHWLIEDTLTTIASWRERPLEERYKV